MNVTEYTFAEVAVRVPSGLQIIVSTQNHLAGFYPGLRQGHLNLQLLEPVFVGPGGIWAVAHCRHDRTLQVRYATQQTMLWYVYAKPTSVQQAFDMARALAAEPDQTQHLHIAQRICGAANLVPIS